MVLASLSVRSAVALTGLALLCWPALAQGTAEERSACMDDAFRFCGSDIPNVSKIEACLIQNMGKLSKGCQDEFHRAPVGRTDLKREQFK